MASGRTFTLSELARNLGAPQHKLIHLCEKGAIAPELQDAAGRGSSRLFSARNFLEFAIALRLRSMMLPVAAVGAILHVLRGLERMIQNDVPEFSLPDNLRDAGAPDLRLIISDGATIYFSLGDPGAEPKLFGGIPVDGQGERQAEPRVFDGPARRGHPSGGFQNEFGGPEGSLFVRLELSVTAIARDLPLD